jgi:hypothetical protein
MPTINSLPSAPLAPQGFAAALDTSSIITKVESIKQARALPGGSVVGDLHGGLTFSDAIAAALESRSRGGWQEIGAPSGETWTIIILDL